MSGIQMLNKGSTNKIKLSTTPEQEKALRDALHTEIENKHKSCSNRTYDCTIPRINGYEYCIRHILQDSKAPYRQCAYIYPNNKKCTQAAPKHDPKKDIALTNYCFEHNRLMQLTKTRNSIGKYKQVDSNETLLNDLTHHLNIDKNQPIISSNDTDEEIVDVVTSNVEPFVNYNFTNDFDKISQSIRGRKRILDYASDSSSDGDVPTLSNTSKAYEWDSSDDESLDSAEEDTLKHAVIYTTEEATLITKQKMMKLQSLYMDQIDRLYYVFKEKRKKYIQSLRKERETLCSIHDQPKESQQERQLYEKLKALNHYHRKYGVEAVLYKKFKEKRLKSTQGYIQKGTHGQVKCIYTEGGVKCGEKVIPCCKYCRKHILEDKRQCLFRACGIEKSGIICQEPVPNIFDDASCVLHISLSNTPKVYVQKKYESETEEDEDEMNSSEMTIKKEQTSLTEDSIVNTDLVKDEEMEIKIEKDIEKEMELIHTDIKQQNISLDENKIDDSVKSELDDNVKIDESATICLEEIKDENEEIKTEVIPNSESLEAKTEILEVKDELNNSNNEEVKFGLVPK